MSRGTSIPITPEVLKWAIAESGFNQSELAERIGVEHDTLSSWMRGNSQPLLSQFKNLTSALKRPAALFFLPEPPLVSLPQIQFRHPPGIDRNSLNPKERRFLREAARMQRTLSWLNEELQFETISLPKVSTSEDLNQSTSRVRQLVDVSESQQTTWKSSSEALRSWREALEKLGVYVFFLSLGKDSARGFSLWDKNAPLIAINTWWNNEARIFTLFHEFAHLLTRTNSACIGVASRISTRSGDQTERWCERFAASFLIPKSSITSYLSEKCGWKPGRSIGDIEIASLVANRYKVSLRASVLRLIELKIASWDLYDAIPPVSDDKSLSKGGKGRNRTKIREDQFGFRTARTILAGVTSDVLSRTDALSYLDVTDSALDDYAARLSKG